MTTISVKVDDRNVNEVVAAVREQLLRPRKAMKVVARTLEQLIRDTFRTETNPWGQPWPPHSPVTVEQRERAGQASVQKLIDSGALYSSIVNDAGDDFARVDAGDGLEYALVQQFGNEGNLAWGQGSAPIPARAFFPLTSETEADAPGDWIARLVAPLEAGLREAAA